MVSGYYLSSVSCLSLLFISVDRYIAIFHAYYYAKIKHDKTIAIKAAVLARALCIVFIIILFLAEHSSARLVLVVILLPVCLTWSLYVQVRTILTVRSIQHRICTELASIPAKKCHRMSTFSTTADTSDEQAAPNSYISKNSRSQFSPEHVKSKATRIAAMILGTMLICYLPNNVLTIIIYYYPYSDLVTMIFTWSQLLVVLNSTLNTLVYSMQLN